MTQIIIEIRGGVLTTVLSNTNDFQYLIVDHDNIDMDVYESESKKEDNFDLSAHDADYVAEDLAKFYSAGAHLSTRTKRLSEIIDREFNQPA